MKLLSFFSIFGFSSCKAQEISSIQHGNFSIQRGVLTEKESGSVQGREYETRSYLVEYKVLYKGKKIKFPSSLQHENKYNFPWRVYILKDAPKPALIAGSHNMFLITEENDKPKITRLNHGNARFGSIQWLDSNDGNPGDEKQILDLQNDNMVDSSLVLQGGRYLLVNRFTVLDVPSLVHYPFNRNNIFEYDGWRLSLETSVGYEIAVGFSGEFKQVVFRALKLDPKFEGKHLTALLYFNYINDSIHIAPFSKTDLRIESIDYINSLWVDNFFEWDANGRLKLKPNVQPPAWKGKLNFVENYFINYELYPAKESLIEIFINFIKTRYQRASEKKVSVTDETDRQSILMKHKVEIDGHTFQLTYDKKDKKLIFDRHFNGTHSDTYRDMIIAIGKGFNDELLQNKHQEHFGNYQSE